MFSLLPHLYIGLRIRDEQKFLGSGSEIKHPDSANIPLNNAFARRAITRRGATVLEIHFSSYSTGIYGKKVCGILKKLL
jgi:hypothetical protein